MPRNQTSVTYKF